MWQRQHVNGDGETSRDFCHINKPEQPNSFAATKNDSDAVDQARTIAVGDRVPAGWDIAEYERYSAR